MHIRNKFIRKAIDALRQARRREQFGHRLEMRKHGRGKEVHSKLNKDALIKIVKKLKKVKHGRSNWATNLRRILKGRRKRH